MWGETSGVRSEERSHLDSYYIKGDRKGTESRRRGREASGTTKTQRLLREREGGKVGERASTLSTDGRVYE